VTLKLFCTDEHPELESGRSCCSFEAIEDAAGVAARIGIPHHVWDFTSLFHDEVIRPFRDEYLRGRTPNPCVACNARVRFRALLEKTRRAGFTHLATGHHARIVMREEGANEAPTIARGADREKDQAYVLWGIAREDLSSLLFPIGALRKEEVRRLAAEAGLPTAEKPESQDICFLPKGDLPHFLGPMEEGPVLDVSGRRLGAHRGAARYTVGQRRGIGVASSERLYVTAVDPAANTVTVGREEDLLADGALVEEENFHLPEEDLLGAPIEAKIRYRHRAAPARLAREEGGALVLRFDEPQRAVTPGQSAAFYRGEILLGGGIIASALRP
jgi:tRNA-specific 2-thiouridylase